MYATPSRTSLKISFASSSSRKPFFWFLRYWSTELPPPYSMMRFILMGKSVQSCEIRRFSTVLWCLDGRESREFPPLFRCFSLTMLSTVFSHKSLWRFYVLSSSPHHSWPKRGLLDLNLGKIVCLWTTSLAFFVTQCLSLPLLFVFSMHSPYFLPYLSWQKQACLCVFPYLCCFLSAYPLPPSRYCYLSRTKACLSIFPA